MSAALELRGVAYAYPRTPVFSSLDFRLSEGEMTALLGPNGAGKTTLVRLAAGSMRPHAGSVLLFGEDVAAMPARERARRVAVVPQQTHPAFDFTVEAMVRLGRAPHLGILGVEGPADREIAREAMEWADVAHLASRPFLGISGGERQRALIARALAQQARLLLLDEPTAFLDLRHRLDAYEVLHRLNRERGLTVLVVSHDLNLAARQCARVVLLRDGRIVADGAPEAVLVPASLREAYDVDVDVHRDPATGRPYVVPRASGPRP